jgi:hypothetical protein
MNKTTSAALAALPEGCALSLRTQTANPNHHLWWNNGTWWLHATVHRPDYTKQRLRLPLETKNVGLARSRRDAVLGAWSVEQRAWSPEHGAKSHRKQRTVRASSFNSSLVTSHSSLQAEAACAA